ncbi:MAG: CBS domain-containing protein [Rhodocyclaceae bacterium]|nr:CBS domain-containing protein [Rhodocyclaceae bacterium]MBX3668022.1 CBS domain-containing protein [Rhodocyclaceae bacterium]
MSNRPIRKLIENRPLYVAAPECTVSEAARQMKAGGVGALLVVEGGHLKGIFTERDALNRVLAVGLSPQSTKLSEVMTPDPQTIGPERPVGHALHLMFEGGYRHVPVVENGQVLGMVSARDALGPELSEFEAELAEREHIGEIL